MGRPGEAWRVEVEPSQAVVAPAPGGSRRAGWGRGAVGPREARTGEGRVWALGDQEMERFFGVRREQSHCGTASGRGFGDGVR